MKTQIKLPRTLRQPLVTLRPYPASLAAALLDSAAGVPGLVGEGRSCGFTGRQLVVVRPILKASLAAVRDVAVGSDALAPAGRSGSSWGRQTVVALPISWASLGAARGLAGGSDGLAYEGCLSGSTGRVGGRSAWVGALVLAGLLPLLAGCQVLTYRSATGERLTRASLGGNTSISSLDVHVDTNGVRRVELRGYQHDSAQAMGAVTEAAVRAAITSSKP